MQLTPEEELRMENSAREEAEMLDENGKLKLGATIPGAWYSAPAKSKPWYDPLMQESNR